MDTLSIFKDLAIILVATKLFGLIARKIKVPQVVGEIIAGLVIGPCLLGWVCKTDFLSAMSEIGVVLLMFSAGLGTDLKELVRTGPFAFLIACAGVLVPLAGGTGIYLLFGMNPGTNQFFEAVFMGTIMTATSVSITVKTLLELGHLKSKVGTTILSAAIIDDIIGIVLLTFVIGFKDPKMDPVTVTVQTLLFFLFAVVFGFGLYFAFKWLDKRNPHTRRIPIFGLALCFVFAFCAEEFFGIADITGAYVAGIVLCNIKDSGYIERKMDINSYMIFGPIFFAGIGLQTSFDNFNMSVLWFTLALVAVALITKVIGCGGMARLCRFSNSDSLKIGVGMMNRGEVALIVAQKGMNAGLLDPSLFSSIIVLIIVSSITTPIILKLLYTKSPDKKSGEKNIGKDSEKLVNTQIETLEERKEH